ncbi:MAG: hypothetical protein HRU50_15055 [Winogradskyella sp.]|uniref:hypothetical protein n=1 Tax=Winogradskyella sp. TaxID=1883156 RepID=UPI0025F76C8C|nr:hypothetical protein [Winogradskyella sp.]NRB61239.1 hypothetical protein [Winogradskyella sp.]
MKNLVRICILIILVCLLSFTLNAQESYAKLEQNKNIQAKDLIHKLNKTKDTLILQSDTKINYLYSINKDYGRDYDFYVDANYYELPLNKLKKGKHVLVAVQSPKRIVFVVKILKDIPKSNTLSDSKIEVVALEPEESSSGSTH